MEIRMKSLKIMMAVITVFTPVGCSSIKPSVIQPPTQTPTEMCVWAFTDFTLDPSSLNQAFSSAGINVSDVQLTGNGEGGNCSTGYGDAVLFLSFSLDDVKAEDEEALGKLLETVVEVIHQWAISSPPPEVLNFSDNDIYLKIVFASSTAMIDRSFSEIYALWNQSLTPSDFWNAAITE